VSERYEFIDGEKANYPIIKMCCWLDVSKSGFYDWRKAPMSATAERRDWLKRKITEVFTASNETYGYRRVHAALGRAGIVCGPELVRALMAELGLVPCQPRPYRVTTQPDETAATPDLVGRDFTAKAPGEKLVGDITYIRTWAGWLYLATVIDCHTKAVIGWAMGNHMRSSLVCDALRMAARNYTLKENCVFHSDRGVQYTSEEYRRLLKDLKVRPSVGRTGVCWDNALAESFFASLKNELVYRTVFPDYRRARTAIARYIEVFYNRQRLHSGLGYKTPDEVYIEYFNSQIAA
jgi:putative transposase